MAVGNLWPQRPPVAVSDDWATSTTLGSIKRRDATEFFLPDPLPVQQPHATLNPNLELLFFAAMHRCLQIEEIVRMIAGFTATNFSGSKGLLNMALVCRAFYDPAMDPLWRVVECSIDRLVRLLPEHCLNHNVPLSQIPVGPIPYASTWSPY